MSQLQWILLDDFGSQYKVGLYHGDRSGHLLVYCNLKIIIIDFYVRDSKTYSFFLGDEFCELKLEKRHNRFRYGLIQNTQADTPLNSFRKNRRKKNRIKTAILTFAFIAFICLITYLFLMSN